MNILVTGGAGFIGTNLCERLVADGHDVVSLDNYFTGSTDNHVAGVTYVIGGTRSIHEVLPTDKFDIIYHLGEYARVEQSFEDWDLVYKFNKLGTMSVLEYAKKINAKLVYAGSSTKFADNHDGYIKSPYTWSKESNTELVKLFCQWNSIDYAITYFYNVYGPREMGNGKYGTLIALFKEKIKNGEPLTIVLPGSQRRNFTHVDDIVDGLIIIGEKGYGDELGIGHDESYSVMEVAGLFGGPIKILPERKGNRISGKVVTDRTKALGWYPKRNLEDYIQNGC